MNRILLPSVLGVVLLAIAAVGAGPTRCTPVPVEPPRDASCDDGLPITCKRMIPICEDYEILAYQDGCYACVDPGTCRPWGEPGCASDAECGAADYCDTCATSSCPVCDDCVADCRPHGCATEPEATCDAIRPDCGPEGVAVVRDGCWLCVDRTTCEPARDAHCDDGTMPLCEMMPPVCDGFEILAYRNNCYVCVNPATCVPWGEPGCRTDADCAPTDVCNDCASGSCPVCLDCVAGCTPHGCPSEPVALCNMVRPECANGQTAVVRDGCWVCVALDTCQPVGHDPRCDDGTEPICDRIPPVCNEFEIFAYQANCYVCVNPATCHPWGEAGCRTDADCPEGETCDPCGTSSCPVCDNCLPACRP